MAHHQQTNHDRMHAMQSAAVSKANNNPGTKHVTDEEEPGDVDEPPDLPLRFSKLLQPNLPNTRSDDFYKLSPQYRQASLLTQALTSPELTPLSDGEAPVLTSDGGMTSPARTTTPSPPLPALSRPALPLPSSHDISHAKASPERSPLNNVLGVDRKQEVKVEEELGRRRCISFACSQKKPSPSKDLKSTSSELNPESALLSSQQQPKRSCLLRFACPSKPPRSQPREPTLADDVEHLPPRSRPEETDKPVTTRPLQSRSNSTNSSSEGKTLQQHREIEGADKSKSAIDVVADESGARPFNRIDYQKCEATRFHEFAGSFTEEDEWTKEQTAYRKKITIDDTLRKENVIRKIAEEAEAEALDEEDGSPFANDEDLDDVDEVSDEGNETDDEEGFADSDDESDFGSTYQFWTPGLTTAATSTEHMDHIRPTSRRMGSESSIESTLDFKARADRGSSMQRKERHNNAKLRHGPTLRPGSSDLPDSSDFVVGTIDEDRRLEERYMSRLKRREQLKQKIIPQDIDPSFPNSDPEAENDEDDEQEEEEESDSEVSTDGDEDADGQSSDHSVNKNSTSEGESLPRRARIPLHPSPRRFRSPAPQANRLFNQQQHRLRSPPPMHRKLSSPPSSRRPSLDGASRPALGIPINHLAARPNLTHTTSLPRTPNPFWMQHRKSGFHASETPPTPTSSMKSLQATTAYPRGRGPIEIVQGLEAKRQRRKEKYWRQHCKIAHAGKEKERKCQPGKGAERMREVGLEMADRFKGYKQGSQLVLSV